MVERIAKKFNKPIGKIREFPIFWLTELRKSEWHCQNCRSNQKPGSVAFELCVRRAIKGYKTYYKTPDGAKEIPGSVGNRFIQWLKSQSDYSSSHGIYQQTQDIDKAVKIFICLDCAKKLLEDALDRVDTVRKHGIKGYRFMDEM